MNAKSQRKQAKINPNGKASRQEVSDFVDERTLKLISCISMLTDHLIEKGVINLDEFTAYVAARNAPNGQAAPVPTPAAESPGACC